MNIIRAYKLSLLLPIIVPILFAPALFFIRSIGESGATVLMTILYSLVYGGIPYLILVGILLFWMRGKDETQIRRALLLSPLLMLVILRVATGSKEQGRRCIRPRTPGKREPPDDLRD